MQRADLEFMGRMLGLRPGIDYEPGGLATAVALGTLDPVASARAQQRIGALINALPIPYQQATLCGDPRMLDELPMGAHGHGPANRTGFIH